jgi:hypothetical protein
MSDPIILATRAQIIHALHEAAELEHNLMCAYLYAAFSLKDEADGLTAEETEAVRRWRQDILGIAREEMSHLTAVWNITAAIGGSPRFGRNNFPLERGYLPAGLVVKLAPFSADVLQHFIYLERPEGSSEPEGKGFEPTPFTRGSVLMQPLTPMSFDYATVGAFYRAIEDALAGLAARIGEDALFCGDRALQMSPAEAGVRGAHVVGCSKTALEALAVIVTDGEGAPDDNANSHFSRFVKIRDEHRALLAKNPDFEPAHPAAVNPALRRPPTPAGRVWIEDPETAAVADLANAVYETLVRLLGHSYSLPSPDPEKGFSVRTAIGLMRALTLLAESVARRPAGPAHPDVNGGVSFVALRDAAPLPAGQSTRRLLTERLQELSAAAAALDQIDPRLSHAAGILQSLSQRADEALAGPSSPQPAVLEHV